MVRVQSGSNCTIEDAVYGKFQDPHGNTIKFSKIEEFVGGVVSDDGNYLLQFGSGQNFVINKTKGKPKTQKVDTKSFNELSKEAGITFSRLPIQVVKNNPTTKSKKNSLKKGKSKKS